MNSQSQLTAGQFALLKALETAADLNPALPRLSSEQVNSAGHSLGFTDAQIFALVEELKTAGLADVHWGANLTITAQGRRAISGASSLSQPIYIINNSTVVQNATITNAAVGSGAQVLGQDSPIAKELTKAQVQMITIVADLVSANRRIQETSAQLQADLQPHIRDLGETADQLGRELQKPKPATATLDRGIARAKDIISAVGGIPKAATALAPLLTVIGRAVEWLTANVGSLPSWPFTSL